MVGEECILGRRYALCKMLKGHPVGNAKQEIGDGNQERLEQNADLGTICLAIMELMWSPNETAQKEEKGAQDRILGESQGYWEPA